MEHSPLVRRNNPQSFIFFIHQLPVMTDVIIWENEQLTKEGILKILQDIKMENNKRLRNKMLDNAINGLKILWGMNS